MLNPKDAKQTGIDWVEAHGQELIELSKRIWEHPELGLEEQRSSQLLIDFVTAQGFSVERNVAGIPTAFVAAWGQGKPVIGVNCEYDALPGLSQELVPQKQPLVPGAPGHGCGHNLLGVGGVAQLVGERGGQDRDRPEGHAPGCPASPGHGSGSSARPEFDPGGQRRIEKKARRPRIPADLSA